MASSPFITPKQNAELPSPEILAGELRHLPGFVFFDSSSAGGEISPGDLERYSLLSACPTKTIEGNLFDPDDSARLQAAYESGRRSEAATPDLGFLTDGLYGYIGYEGDFVFGEYRECLIYDHCQQTWFEIGTLSQRRKRNQFREFSASLPARPFAKGASREEFCAMVRRAQEYIAAGDIYQVNLSHQFTTPVSDSFDGFGLHLRLRDQSPAPTRPT